MGFPQCGQMQTGCCLGSSLAVSSGKFATACMSSVFGVVLSSIFDEYDLLGVSAGLAIGLLS